MITINIYKLKDDLYEFLSKKHGYGGTLEECLEFLSLELKEYIPMDKMKEDPQFNITREVYKNDKISKENN